MYPQVPLNIPFVSPEDTILASHQVLETMRSRRSVRFFSPQQVPEATISNLLCLAGLSPSGANKQPWTFCVVSNPNLKRQIREAAEQEEKLSYENRMSEEWLADLAPLGTDWHKPFLETAPYLIIIFRHAWTIEKDGKKGQTYYSIESTGIASGMLISAIHQCGLVTLTHTPSPMGFLKTILGRPENERPFLLLPIGYPAKDATVPELPKKALSDFVYWYK